MDGFDNMRGLVVQHDGTGLGVFGEHDSERGNAKVEKGIIDCERRVSPTGRVRQCVIPGSTFRFS